MKLEAGQTVIWEQVSETECRIIIQPRQELKPNPVAAIGFAQRRGLPVMRTKAWMLLLREGEKA
jgi:hypothetical protein